MRRLQAHPWPGNVRELEAVLEEAMIFRNRGALRPDDLTLDDPRDARHEDGTSSATQPASSSTSAGRQEVALGLAAAQGAVTRRQLASACGISGELARQELLALVRLGRLRRLGSGRAARYVGL